MARRDALLKITQLLLNKRNDLRKRLGLGLDQLQGDSFGVGDTAEAAFAASGDEINSQLAQLEANELAQIEMALSRVKQGMYGTCAGCECKIPVGRLTALPYSVLCIKCQREVEKDSTWLEDRLGAVDFNKLQDAGSDRDFSVAEFEMNYSR
jgi:DnaK suppressor protein